MANCIFCNSKKVSKEHLWGAWWQDYYPASAQDLLKRDGHTITVRDSNDELIALKGLFSNVGDVLAKTTKVVCQSCNNTWMSQIEQEMKKTFQRLFIDEEENISSDEILSLKKWMYLKFCLIDRAYNSQDSLVPNSLLNSSELKEKLNFMKKEKWKNFLYGTSVPKEFHFFIGRSTNDLKIGSFNYTPLILFKNDNSLDIKLIESCMFFNGHFIGVLTSSDSLITALKNEEKFQGLFLLDQRTKNFTIKNKVSALEFEDSTLTELEKIIEGRRLRRNFS